MPFLPSKRNDLPVGVKSLVFMSFSLAVDDELRRSVFGTMTAGLGCLSHHSEDIACDSMSSTDEPKEEACTAAVLKAAGSSVKIAK